MTPVQRWVTCPTCRRPRQLAIRTGSEIVRAESRPCRKCAQRTYRQGPP